MSWSSVGTSPYALCCLAFAALAAFLAVPAPARLTRARASRPLPAVVQRGRVLARGRPGAPPLGRRLLVGAAAALALCYLGASAAAGPGAAVWLAFPLLTLGCGVALGWLEPGAVRRRRVRLVMEGPQALELMAACLAAGMPVRRACAAVVEAFDGPVAEDLGKVTALVHLGVPDGEAWRTLQGHAQFGPAAQDLARSVESGIQLVDSLRHHATLARERRSAAQQVVARSIGVRSVLPMMTCFIPAFLLLGVVPALVSALSRALLP